MNDPLTRRTETFHYDMGGNILERRVYAYTTAASPGTPTQVIAYSYGDANWKDRLTAYNGQAISCDAIGNPTDDGVWTYRWRCGRQLAETARAGDRVTYQYGDDGLRTRKESTAHGTTEYFYTGGRLSHQRRRGVNLHFWYDDAGRPSVVWYNCDSYYYVYNVQGDVIALVRRETMEEVVAYAYDAWGKQVSCTGALAGTLGVENPFRYRGYVYDEETGWYWLRSRYYRPEWGRFLNADGVVGKIGKMIDHNLFAYCRNNPVVFSDPSGLSLTTALKIMAVLLIVPLKKTISNIKSVASVAPGGLRLVPFPKR